MPLTWNVEKIKHYKNVTTDPSNHDRWSPLTEALVWMTVTIGIHKITESNHEKFFARCRLFELVNGSSRFEIVNGKRREKYLTLQDIKSHIGLTTNASEKTDIEFLELLTESLIKDDKS